MNAQTGAQLPPEEGDPLSQRVISGIDPPETDPAVIEFVEALADFIVEAVELSLNRTAGAETHAEESADDDLMTVLPHDTNE